MLSKTPNTELHLRKHVVQEQGLTITVKNISESSTPAIEQHEL